MQSKKFDLNEVLTPQLAYWWWKSTVATLKSSNGEFTIVHNIDSVESRKDKAFFERASIEFGVAKAWVFYIIIHSIRGGEVYIRDLINSNSKTKIWMFVKKFFDDPVRWIMVDVKRIQELIDNERYTQLKSEILTLRINPLSYAWICREYGMDFLRYDDIYVVEFKRMIGILSQIIDLNNDVEAHIKRNIETLGV